MWKAIIITAAVAVISLFIVLQVTGLFLKHTVCSRRSCQSLLHEEFEFNKNIDSQVLGSFTVSLGENLSGTGFEFTPAPAEPAAKIVGRQIFSITQGPESQIDNAIRSLDEPKNGNFKSSNLNVTYSIGKSKYGADSTKPSIFAKLKSTRNKHSCLISATIQNYSGPDETEQLLLSLKGFCNYLNDLK